MISRSGIPVNLRDIEVDIDEEAYEKGVTMLKAVRAACPQRLASVLDRGAEINSVLDKCGNTAMHAACMVGSLPCVQLLVERGANVNAANAQGHSPLHLASLDGDDDLVRFLISKKVLVNQKDNNGFTPLHMAAMCSATHEISMKYNNLFRSVYGFPEVEGDRTGDADFYFSWPWVGRTLAGRRGAEIKLKGFDGNSDLTRRNEIIFNVLLEAGANVNAVEDVGNTALHLCVVYGNTNMLKRLLDTEIDVHLPNNNGMTAYYLAISFCYFDIAYLFLERNLQPNVPDKHGYTLLHRAVTVLNTDLVQKLVTKMGVNLNRKTYERMTVLHLALVHSHNIGVHILLANEIKGISGERSGRTLFMSILRRDKISLEKVLNNNSDVTYRDCCGKTALHWAVLRRFSFGVDLLLRKGVDVNAQDCLGNTALHLAVLTKKEEIITKLLSDGADVNLQDEDKRTALHFAVIGIDNPGTSTVAMLVKAGGLIDMQDCDGNTPLHLAVKENDNYSALHTLLVWGARTDLKNNSGESCIFYFKTAEVIGRSPLLYHIVYLREAKLQTYNIGINFHEFEDFHNLWCIGAISYDKETTTKHCKKEFNEMIALKIGRFHLYDIFAIKDPGVFVLDNELKSAILSDSILKKLPYYGQMLQATFLKNEARYRRLIESLRLPLAATVSGGNEVHLPKEVKWMIFSLLLDEDLVNIIRVL